MSSLLGHIWQAGRNERLAKHLFSETDFSEWGVTVAFYSAIHFVEAAFTNLPNVVHSETSRPQTFRGSFHDWRQYVIQTNFPRDVWISYRTLRTQSNISRYLVTDTGSPAGSPIGKPAEQYFSSNDVNTFIYSDLYTIRSKLGF